MLKDFLFFRGYKSKAMVICLALSAAITVCSMSALAKDYSDNSRIYTSNIVPTKQAFSKGNKNKNTSINLLGNWEAEIRRNRYQKKISWNSKKRRYEGRLSKQGWLSNYVGFTKNELILEVYAETEDKLVGKQKMKRGRNGRTTKAEFVRAEIYLDKDTPNTFTMHLLNNRGFTTRKITYKRVK